MDSPAGSVCLANMEKEEVEVLGFVFALNGPSAVLESCIDGL